MYYKIKTINKCGKFITENNYLSYSFFDKKTTLIINEKVIYKGNISTFYKVDSSVFIIDNYEKLVFIDLQNNSFIEFQDIKGIDFLLSSKEIVYGEWNEDYSKRLITRFNIAREKKIWTIESYFGKGKIIDNYFYTTYHTDNLGKIDLNFPEKSIWQFNLETLGKFEDRDGNLQNYEVHKFIGAWQNSILVACSGQLVLDINSKTGELNRKWQSLPGYGSSAFQGRLQHKIPSTDGFQLDISKSYLYHLAGAYLVTIDLVTGKADYQSLKNTLEEHVFSGFRWSTGYAEDETHIYTIAEMNRFELGLDYIPQCIVAFNKKTLKIDWHYRFEGDWVKTDIPQLANNKLYQLSGDNTLYIFEKEE